MSVALCFAKNVFAYKTSVAFQFTIYGENLSLCVSENDSAISFELALSVAEYFDITCSEAVSYVDKVKSTIESEWREIASKYKLGRSAISFMEPAFDMNFKK